MTKLTLSAMEHDLEKRHLYMVVVSQAELKKGKMHYTWVASIHAKDQELVSVRRESLNQAKFDAYAMLPEKTS